MESLPVAVQWSEYLVVACVLFLSFALVTKRLGADSLIWWPIFLYIPGPLAAYLLFSGAESFGAYLDPRAVFVSTFILAGGLACYRLALGRRVARQVEFDIACVERSPVANGSVWPFVLLGLLCIATQTLLIRDTGESLLSGGYVLANGSFEENRAIYTLTAGLYEIFAALLAFRIVGGNLTFRRHWMFLSFSFAVIAMRMLGGTRLVVLELLIFVLMVQLLRRRISRKGAIGASMGIGAALAIIGSLRGSQAAEGSNLLFLLFAEPGLSNLSATFVTSYYLEHGDFINPNCIVGCLGYLLFIAVHLLPNVLYQGLGGDVIYLGDWGYYRSWGAPFYPFRDILAATGLETVSPVGGQSVVALGVALLGYGGAVLIVPLIYGAFSWLRSALPKSMPLILILGFEAPSIYREGAEIFGKQVFIIALAYWLFSKLCVIPILSDSHAQGSTVRIGSPVRT
jgi:hypothetical protein